VRKTQSEEDNKVTIITRGFILEQRQIFLTKLCWPEMALRLTVRFEHNSMSHFKTPLASFVFRCPCHSDTAICSELQTLLGWHRSVAFHKSWQIPQFHYTSYDERQRLVVRRLEQRNKELHYWNYLRVVSVAVMTG